MCIRFTVIDEADELLSDGWEETMEKLFQGGGKLLDPILTFGLTLYRRERRCRPHLHDVLCDLSSSCATLG